MKSKQNKKFRRLEESLDEIKNPYENLEYHLFREFRSYRFSVAVPKYADEELKRKIYAALKSHAVGIKSVDYVLKRYGINWKFTIETKNYEDIIADFLSNVLNDFLTILYNFSEEIKAAHAKAPGIMGIVAADLALQRCISSFEAIAVLMRRGYFIEPKALLRNILEQTAWAYAVSHLDKIEEIERTSASNSISLLKKLFPNAGEIYGELSNYVHLDAKKRHEYFGLFENQDFVLLRSKDSVIEILPLLIIIADMYVALYELLHIEYYENTSSWRKISKGKIRRKSKRPLKNLLLKLSDYLDEVKKIKV